MSTPTQAAGRPLRWTAEVFLLAGLLALAILPDRFVLRPKLLGQTAILLACGLALAQLAVRARAERRWTGLLALGLLPAGLGLVHLLHTRPPSWALAQDEILRLLLVPLVAWAVSSVVACEGPARSRLLLALAVGTAWAAGYALLQRVGAYRYLDLGIAAHHRAHGGFENPVFLGGWLVLSLPPLLAEALMARGRTRWPCAVAAGLGLPALIATDSAGAWGGFGVAAVLAFLLLMPRSRRRRSILLIGTLGALVLAFIARDVLTRPRNHALIWRDTLSMVAEAPGGVGPGQYPLAFLPYASDELLATYPRREVIINDAHSEVLQLGAELGWAAFGAVLLLAFAAALTVKRTRASQREKPALDGHRFPAAVAALTGSVAMSFVSPDLRFGVTPLLFGALLGLAAAFDGTPARSLRGGLPTRLGVAALALVVLGFGAGEAHRRYEITLLARPRATEPARPDPALQAAIPELLDAIAEDPGDAARHAALGFVLEQLRRHREAAEAFRAALRRREGDVQIARHMGVNEVLSGQYGRAVRTLSAVLEANPDDVDARYLLAYAHYGLGNLLNAMREVETLLERDPEHAQARVLREGLRE